MNLSRIRGSASTVLSSLSSGFGDSYPIPADGLVTTLTSAGFSPLCWKVFMLQDSPPKQILSAEICL